MSASPSTVRLLAFAGARELCGAAELELAVPALAGAAECSQAELWSALLARFPALSAYRSSIRLALNGAYAERDERVRAGDEVAIIPPVAGG